LKKLALRSPIQAAVEWYLDAAAARSAAGISTSEDKVGLGEVVSRGSQDDL